MKLPNSFQLKMFVLFQAPLKQCVLRSDFNDPELTALLSADRTSGDQTRRPDRALDGSEIKTSESREEFRRFSPRTPTWMKTSPRIMLIQGKFTINTNVGYLQAQKKARKKYT